MDKLGFISGRVPTSRIVLCCSAKSWARVLGWIHIVLAALELLAFSIIFIPLLAAIGSLGGDSKQMLEDAEGVRLAAATISLSISVIGICLLTLFEGILLVKGVSEENPSKLQCWLIIEWILIAFAIITVMLKLVTVPMDLNDFVSASVYMISIPPSCFCCWVVNVHRKELLSAGRTGSIFGSLSWSQNQNQHQLLRIEEGGDGDDSVLIK